MSTVAAETAEKSELENVLRKTLEASRSPLSANQISSQLIGPFRRSKKELQESLEAMAEAGQIHRIGKFQRAERYWDRKPEDYARVLMLEKLTECPQTRADLLRAVESELRMLSKNRREEILRELVRGGEVKELPPFLGARSKRLSPRPGDPRDYVEHALKKVCEQLAKNGISDEQVRAAAREVLGNAPSSAHAESAPPSPSPTPASQPKSAAVSDGQDLVLARVMEIEVGALMPFTEFRQGLDFQDRSEVDHAIWDLVRNELVAIHKHHHPISMSEAEREASLRDDEGNLYHAISRRYR